MTMSEAIAIEQALPPIESLGGDETSTPELIHEPSEVSSTSIEDHAQTPSPPEDTAMGEAGPSSPQIESQEMPKVVPKPVTIEDVPESEPEPAKTSVVATATTEPALPGHGHLTPKVTLSTAGLPATTQANEVLPSLPSPSAFDKEAKPLGAATDEITDPAKHVNAENGSSLLENTTVEDASIQVPTALSYLDPDSPPVTNEAIRQSTLNAARRSHPGVSNASPSSYGHSSVGSAAYQSDVFSRADYGIDSTASWSPSDRHSLKSEGYPTGEPHAPEFHRSWTSPEARMPPPPMSHIGGSPPQPRFPPPSPYPFNEHIPPSGYQFLATKLAGDIGGMQIKPIYRRFEVLNHRLLLSLQDEIQNLEEQLHGIDLADTQNRTFPGGIYPASLRHEAASNSEQFWRKTDILTQIGYRLHQYNKLLISFRDTTDLPAPTINDIQDYRAFLSHGNYIVPDETRFLATTNDLITLDEAMLRGTDELSEDLLTPVPRSATEPEFPIQLKSGAADGESIKRMTKPSQAIEPVKSGLPPAAITQLALAIFVAVLVPIFTFAVIPDFSGRITVVVLVASSVLSTLLQSGLIKLLIEDRGVLALMLSVLMYGGVMATTATTFR